MSDEDGLWWHRYRSASEQVRPTRRYDVCHNYTRMRSYPVVGRLLSIRSCSLTPDSEGGAIYFLGFPGHVQTICLSGSGMRVKNNVTSNTRSHFFAELSRFTPQVYMARGWCSTRICAKSISAAASFATPSSKKPKSFSNLSRINLRLLYLCFLYIVRIVEALVFLHTPTLTVCC